MFDYITEVLLKPVPTLREVAAKRMWQQGLLLILLLCFLRGLVNTALARDTVLPPNLEALGPAKLEELPALLQSPTFQFTNSFLTGFFAWFSGGIVFFLLGKLFKGKGSLSGLLASLGFAKAPALIQIPLTAILSLLGTPGKLLIGITSFGFTIWIIVLDIYAVRESLEMDTWKAIATVLIPVVLLFFGVLLLLAVLVVMITLKL
ncbi:MAG: Uncharacterized protein XD63_0325 [Thermoanaerobacterales bacterium 50_218]|nr:MAG: Uncharacterized protein XD63_0325 [Thermoanaerobacterales bacterium 50_218]HAA90597.1 hypothetical protein [Peptococcaceae bacterium]